VIAAITGLGHSLVGTLLPAVSTSLPETVIIRSAVKLNFLDMAVATVSGANLMYFFLVFSADVWYRRGPLLDDVSDIHLL